MSGSMRGDRYERASDELIRSVNELTEGQRFYVLLFSDNFVQMFDEESHTPKTVQATSLNKQRLERWIKRAFRGGSTDPRAAVQLAIRMRPSTIFMLSDGKFKDPKKNSRSKRTLFDSDRDVFEMVKASQNRVPIQAIAFEERIACENMKRLSFMTGGKYRFVGNQDSELAAEVLKEASDSLKAGDFAEAERRLRRVISAYGNTEPAWQAREKLARMIFESARESLRLGDVSAAGGQIQQLVAIDPSAIVTEVYQTPIVNELMKLATESPPTSQTDAAHELLSTLMAQHPEARIINDLANVLIKAAVTRAQKLYAAERHVDAFVVLDKCVTQFARSAHIKDVRDKHRTLGDGLIQRARSIKQTHGAEAYLTHLQNLSKKTKGTSMPKRLLPLLSALAVEMARGAKRGMQEEARAARLKIAKQIAEDLGDPALLKEAEMESTRAEVRARSMLRSAQRVERTGDVASAMNRYQVLVKSFPDTIAAETARTRWRALRLGILEQQNDGSSSLEQMVRDANAAKSSQ